MGGVVVRTHIFARYVCPTLAEVTVFGWSLRTGVPLFLLVPRRTDQSPLCPPGARVRTVSFSVFHPDNELSKCPFVTRFVLRAAEALPTVMDTRTPATRASTTPGTRTGADDRHPPGLSERKWPWRIGSSRS